MKQMIHYQPAEIFNSLQINQATWSRLDNEVEDALIDKEDSIFQWRTMNDLVGWSELYKIKNKEFNISLEQNEWLEAVQPERKKTVWQLCEFIAGHAKKELIKPIRIMGADCLEASAFLSLKRDLSKWGIEIKNLRPSSSINRFVDNEILPKLIAELAKRGVSLADLVRLKFKEDLSFWQKMNFLNPNRYYIDTGTVKNFRDLTMLILKAQEI